MNWFRHYILPLYLIICICFTGKSQTSISGTINIYTNVTNIDDIDQITVASTSGFAVGDTVLVIQMKGGSYDISNGALMSMNGAGRYEFIVINQIIGSNQIEFRSNLINYLDYSSGESMQVVRVPSYDNAIVTAPLTCTPWDGAKGGILALIVNDTLTLNDSIYVNAKGYLGGAYTQNNGLCPITKGLLYYPADKTDSAGFKGESLVSNSFIYKRGRGSVVNGGGGGYGKFAGGGGGGNFGSGGRGGNMMETLPTCSDPNLPFAGSEGSGGKSDKILPYYFGASGSEYKDRVFMGGGGGGGTGTVSSAGTNGGSGGGIVFIITRNLKTNGKYISSNGGDVITNSTSNASAGGGGAGGAIFLSVDEITDPLNVSVKGGKGGSTAYCWGQGGGGGGGIVWFSAEQIPFNTLRWNAGQAGGPSGACVNNAFNGENGDTSNRFNAILNGFLFNLISKAQSICYGEVSQLLKGSYPRGGDRKYKYQWQSRLKKLTTWQNISGANAKDYQPAALYDSTYFRRIVKVFQPQWNDTVIDTSKFIIINVVPEIKFNEILSDTAICYGLPQVYLQGQTPSGGVGGFTYLWETKDGAANWVSAAGVNNLLNYSNTSNTKTLYYRRKVFSTFCTNISDIDTIIVYPKITGNTISASQTICYNYYPSQLAGSIPSNGSGSYIYKWERSLNDSSSWANIGASGQNYAPPKLINKTYYHRIVFSGLNNTCKDTSTWVRISITPSIVGNTIQSAQTICEGSTPSLFTGSQPTGGNNAYRYQWEKSLNKLSWDSVTTGSLLKDFQHTNLFDTTYFRRIIRSGLLDCCKDTSIDIKITVQPEIQNNITSASQEICKGQTPSQLKQLSGSVSGGDKVLYSYSWEHKTTPNGAWTGISGANVSSFQPPSLSVTTYYHRKVISGQCSSFSDSLKMNVLELLEGNTISGNNEVCRGLVPASITGGTITGGEIGVYRYQWQDSTTGMWNSISGAVESNYTPPVIPVKTYYRRIVKSGLNDCCISRSPYFELRINELPVANLSNADTAVCNGKDINLKVAILGNSPFAIEFTDQTNNYSLENLVLGTNAISITPLKTGIIQINSIMDVKGCLASTKTGQAQVRLVEVPQASAGPHADICSLFFKMNATPSIGSGKWLTSDDITFNPSDDDSKAEITVPSYGTYELYWKESNEFCSDSAKITISFFEQPEKPVLANDTTLNYQFKFVLNAPEPLVGNGVWFSNSEGISIQSPNSPNTSAEHLIFGEHKFVWQVSNGSCIPMSDTIAVFVDDILRYTGFSPNNDGVNDEFYVEGLENARTKKLVIMNRWGGVVYSDDDYKNNWKGTNNNGDMLPDDTYYYVLTVDGSRNYKGFIVLKR